MSPLRGWLVWWTHDWLRGWEEWSRASAEGTEVKVTLRKAKAKTKAKAKAKAQQQAHQIWRWMRELGRIVMGEIVPCAQDDESR